MRKLKIVATVKKVALSKFEEKVKSLAENKGGNTLAIVEALAELDYPPARFEKTLDAYLEVVTAGKHLDKAWAQRVSKIVENVRKAMGRG